MERSLYCLKQTARLGLAIPLSHLAKTIINSKYIINLYKTLKMSLKHKHTKKLTIK